MTIGTFDIGVCGWSLKTSGMADLMVTMREIGLNHAQLALSPLVRMEKAQRESELALLREGGVIVTAGMAGFEGENYQSISLIRQTGGFVPPELWDVRRAHALACLRLASELELPAMSTHGGFIPPSHDPAYAALVERVSDVAAEAGKLGVDLLFETGQEKAAELLQFLNDLNSRTTGANFDPANMILYGAGDPVEAVNTIGRHIKHVHIKDATSSKLPGVDWGSEVPFGQGQVPHRAFIEALMEVGYEGPLVIERETGDDRVGEIRRGVATLQELIN